MLINEIHHNFEPPYTLVHANGVWFEWRYDNECRLVIRIPNDLELFRRALRTL